MKLLQKTTRNYLLYSVFILLIAIPVIYITMQRTVREDIDESLLASQKVLVDKITRALADQSIEELHFIDNDIIVRRVSKPVEQISFTTRDVFDPLSNETVPHRMLISGFKEKGNFYQLSIDKSLVDDEDLIEMIVKIQSLLLIVLVGGFFLINRQFSKRIMRPFYNTLAILQKYQVDKHEPLVLATSNINEFNELNQSLQALTNRSYAAYIGQKEFTENASHEMQTPLAVFQSKLELLMQTNPLSSEQALLMGEMGDAIQRMNQLNKSLVLLAKIENNQFLDTEFVSLKDCIEKFILVYQPNIDEKNIVLEYIPHVDIILNANKALVEILIGNLLGNAIRHNKKNGIIKITCDVDRISIKNSGKPFELDASRIFKRFQKDSADSSSIGLGLAMVKKICTLMNVHINYQFEDNLHVFRLILISED